MAPTAVSLPSSASYQLPDDPYKWPDDPDEVPEWRLRQEERAARIGYKLPGQRTRREYERDRHLVLERLVGAGAAAPALPADQAAREFVAALRASGRAGSFSSEELSEAYVQHCAARNIQQTAENVLREALKRVPGVTRMQVNQQRGRNARRQRTMLWEITAVSPAAVETGYGFREAA